MTSDNFYRGNWTSQDQVGALRFLTPDKILQSTASIKKGKVYQLGRVLEEGIPMHWFHGHFLYTTFRRAHESVGLFNMKNNVGGMNVRIEMPDHIGTHIDALNHISRGDALYGGYSSREITGTSGTSKLGIETMPPIVTREILIDVPKLLKVDTVESDYVITPDDIETVLKNNRITIQSGDALLFRTGWGKYWMVDNEKYMKSAPGIGEDSASWIARNKILVVGGDTDDVEVAPGQKSDEAFPCHQILITDNGVPIIENMNLEELSRDDSTQFLFVCLPLRLKGASGSPISPIALV